MNTGIPEYGMTGKTNKVVPGDRVNGQTMNLDFGSASLHLSLNRIKHLTQGEQNDSNRRQQIQRKKKKSVSQCDKQLTVSSCPQIVAPDVCSIDNKIIESIRAGKRHTNTTKTQIAYGDSYLA